MPSSSPHKDTSQRQAKRLMCLATHHKGGTVWMKQIVMALSKAWGIPWIGIWSERQLSKVPDTGRAFLVNWHGTFPKELWDNPECGFLHVVRDPRDILLSGCQYHQTAGPKGEGFLHTPRTDLGGRTYQEHLNALETFEEKLLFEMHNKHAETLAEMDAWPYDHPRQVTVRYEDLMQDMDGDLFADAIQIWGLSEEETQSAVETFWSKSLFGGQARSLARTGHVQSGKIERWRSELPNSVLQVLTCKFLSSSSVMSFYKECAT